MGSSSDELYTEEERVFDFGEEEDPIDTRRPLDRDYGGEDFSSYLHDDEFQVSPGYPMPFSIPRRPLQAPKVPMSRQEYGNAEQEDYYDTIDESKSRSSSLDPQNCIDIASQRNLAYENPNNLYDDAPVPMRYRQNQNDKNSRLSQKIKKQIEKATLRFSKGTTSSIDSGRSSTSMHNFSFADSKMGSLMAEQTDSGIGLEGADETDTIPALKRNSWWSVGTLSSKASPSSTISQHSTPLKGKYANSSGAISQRHKNPSQDSSPRKNTVKSIFKKVTGTLKVNNNNNSHNFNAQPPQRRNLPQLSTHPNSVEINL